MRDCPGGGTIDVSGTMEGSIDRENRTGTLMSEAVIVMAGCVITRREHSITLTTTAPDHLQKTGEVTIQNREHSGTLTIAGSSTWEKDTGESDTCEINISMTVSPDGRSRTGTVCGREINSLTRLPRSNPQRGARWGI
jgi:hypothetical protein